jgi:hypothetical protein
LGVVGSGGNEVQFGYRKNAEVIDRLISMDVKIGTPYFTMEMGAR